ncbi:hypothetical protein [Burkholderia gladioli]|uniref:hypothetical protein n=1 Tax=Burkholderia gladioli TaxID=28095 RepID=UPI0016405C27|nr:hypothetical protein [Burkholderia gladioli]
MENNEKKKYPTVSFRTSKKDDFEESARKLNLNVGEYFHLLHHLYQSDSKKNNKKMGE